MLQFISLFHNLAGKVSGLCLTDSLHLLTHRTAQRQNAFRSGCVRFSNPTNSALPCLVSPTDKKFCYRLTIYIRRCMNCWRYTGLFKKKYTLSKIYFTKTSDAKSMFCVRMERKSLKVLMSMIWSGASLRLWLLLPVTCCDECGKSWIIDLTSATSHLGLTSSAYKVWK
jgi:hypothetical protein